MGNIVSDPTKRWPGGVIFFEFDAVFDQYKPPFDISAPVGVGGVNVAADVRRVQGYLNHLGASPPLAVDGLVGPKTIAAIRQFQTTHFGWQDGRVDPGGPTLVELTIDEVDPTQTEAKGIILNAVHEWNKQLAGHLKWVRRRQQDQNRVVFTNGNFNLSDTLGMKGGEQFVYISITRAQGIVTLFRSGTTRGVVIHEMGHVAGLRHEHQRTDRDNFVQIHWQNVAPGRRCAFMIPFINPTIPDCKDVPPCIRDGPYDYVSTMHYFPTQGGSPQGVTTISAKFSPGRPMGSFNGFSAGDLATLKKFYP